MTNEEKAKAYDEALKRAKVAMDLAADKDLVEGVVRTIFPEHFESDGERIRKTIVKLVEWVKAQQVHTDHFDNGIKWDEMIAYLEKQKECVNLSHSDIETIMIALKESGLEFTSNREVYEKLAKQKESLHVSESCKENANSFTDEDERIRKDLIDYLWGQKIYYESDEVKMGDSQKCRLMIDGIAYLEKQKERGPLTKDEEYTLHRIIEYLEDETCPSEWISLLHDIYCLSYPKQKEQKPTSDWMPSGEKKKETLNGADIGYGLETAIDILENGFTHYQTDDGEYERKQALDVLIFLLNETRKKEDAKLWSKDIVESIVTWAKEKHQLYSMKESTPYVEAVKNNAQKVLDWAKEQWPIYFGWKPSEEQMEALLWCTAHLGGADHRVLAELYEHLKML